MKTLLDVIKDSRPQGSTEVAKNESLARILNKAGFTCEESKRGFDIVGSNFAIEGKADLKRSSDIDRAMHQLERYVKTDLNGRILYVVIYCDIDKAAERELRSKLDGMWIRYQLVCKGMIMVKEAEKSKSSYSKAYHEKRASAVKNGKTRKSSDKGGDLHKLIFG